MPCIPFSLGTSQGIVCIANEPVKLMRGVWMEWHDYLGPMFWRDKDMTIPYHDWYKSPSLVKKFDEWYESTKKGA